MNYSLYEMLLDNGQSRDKVLVKSGDGHEVTYGEAENRSAQISNALVEAGVVPGDRVAVQTEKSTEALMLYLGCLRAGAIFLPLNTAYTSAEMEYFFRDAEPSLVVCDPARRDELEALPGVRAIETLDAAGEGTLPSMAARQVTKFPAIRQAEEAIAAILYTSGTTGRPKGAMLSQGNLLSNARTLTEYWRISSDDVLIHALPIFHAHGLFVAVNTTLIAGASMIFLPKFDADAVLAAMPGATTMMGVPTFYERLLDHPDFGRDVTRGMRLFVSGSAPLRAETHRRFEERSGHRILERYGMTETSMNTSNPYDGERRAGTVGFPLPGIEARVTNPETGSVFQPGEIGVLEVRGPNVFQGYWRLPEKTASEFREDGFFVTGDMAMVDSDGYIHIVGRSKDLIISGGYNVYPKEVETEIDAVNGVQESAVVGVPHPDFGEGVVGVVVTSEETASIEKKIHEHLMQRLARYKHPKRIVCVDELPRNTMGKVQKNLLRERLAGIFE